MPLPMLPTGNELKNREISAVVWLSSSSCLSTKADVHRSTVTVLKSLLRRSLVISLVGVAAWIAMIIGQRVGLWDGALVKDTVLWTFTFGIVRMFGINDLQRDAHFFRNLVCRPI
jgi:hypothetical protein